MLENDRETSTKKISKHSDIYKEHTDKMSLFSQKQNTLKV